MDNSSSRHIDEKKNEILVLGKRSTDGLADTKMTLEAKYFVNIGKSKKKNWLIIHGNVANKFLYGNGIKFHQFKAKVSKINSLCL